MAKKSKSKGGSNKMDVYLTLSATTTDGLDDLVSEQLNEKGWELYGTPYFAGNSYRQAMYGKDQDVVEEEGGEE
jgi:hypothetical protein